MACDDKGSLDLSRPPRPAAMKPGPIPKAGIRKDTYNMEAEEPEETPWWRQHGRGGPSNGNEVLRCVHT